MINVVIEGESDRGVATAIVRAAGHELGKIVVKNGKTKLDPLIPNYNRAATTSAWVVLRDSDTQCPVELRTKLTAAIGTLSPSFLLRIVHPMSEGWLLADSDGFAEHFGIRAAAVPRDPESLAHPKATVLQLCAKSRYRAIRSDMVTNAGRTGPLYVVRVNEFAAEHWNVGRAAENSDSLRRAVERIRRLP